MDKKLEYFTSKSILRFVRFYYPILIVLFAIGCMLILTLLIKSIMSNKWIEALMLLLGFIIFITLDIFLYLILKFSSDIKFDVEGIVLKSKFFSWNKVVHISSHYFYFRLIFIKYKENEEIKLAIGILPFLSSGLIVPVIFRLKTEADKRRREMKLRKIVGNG